MSGNERERSDAEWDAWQDVVTEWRKTVGEINDPKYNVLIKTLTLWSERVVALRETQSSGVVGNALGDAQKNLDALRNKD